MSLPAKLVEAAAAASCRNRHIANKDDGPPFRAWLSCGTEVIAECFWPEMTAELADDLRWFFYNAFNQHREQTSPELIVEAVLAELPECREAVQEVAAVLKRGLADPEVAAVVALSALARLGDS